MDPDKNPLEARIIWNDLTRNRSAGIAKSDPDSGEYVIVLPTGNKYGYSAEKDGYMGASETLDFTDISAYTEYRHDIVLYPLSTLVGEQIPLKMNNIFFDFNKNSLRSESIFELNRWVNVLKKHPDLKAQIHGHTCWIGTEAYNQQLSERRAKAVVNYLVNKGVAPNRLSMKGFGETRPAASNDTKKGRELNRRVEVLFTK
jgi:outer membrane protein OmpA-like peptidoglycan-associated protein